MSHGRGRCSSGGHMQFGFFSRVVLTPVPTLYVLSVSLVTSSTFRDISSFRALPLHPTNKRNNKTKRVRTPLFLLLFLPKPKKRKKKIQQGGKVTKPHGHMKLLYVQRETRRAHMTKRETTPAERDTPRGHVRGRTAGCWKGLSCQTCCRR